jgi:hypothetical protein
VHACSLRAWHTCATPSYYNAVAVATLLNEDVVHVLSRLFNSFGCSVGGSGRVVAGASDT